MSNPLAKRYSENILLGSSKNKPLDLAGRCRDLKRRYTKSKEIEHLAIINYRKNGKGLTFRDLISNGLAVHKIQAQITLKHCLRNDMLFTAADRRPQKYYPTCLKSEIMNKVMQKNIPKELTGVDHFSNQPSNNNDSLVIQTLEGYILPLLPSAPLHIHKLQFKLKININCYHELALHKNSSNGGKEHIEIIGKSRVSYRLYPNGTVMVSCENSNSPSKLEDELDRGRLLAFFGQIRDRLITLLADKHERIIPDIMYWDLTQCDINKDIKVDHWLQYVGIKVQVRHFDHLFRIYIKSMSKDTVCRVDESCAPNKSVIQAINDILNPCERSFIEQNKILVELRDQLHKLVSIGCASDHKAGCMEVRGSSSDTT
jgi:hypothetical protein